MSFDPFLIDFTCFVAPLINGYMDLEEIICPENATDNEEDFDFDVYEISDDYNDLYISSIELNVSLKFNKFICLKEKQYYDKSICEKYFNPMRFPENPDLIINMNRVDVWNIDCAYGLLFQAFIASEYNLDLPCAKKRNRKIPIILANLKRQLKARFNYNKEPIYDELINNCNLTEKET